MSPVEYEKACHRRLSVLTELLAPTERAYRRTRAVLPFYHTEVFGFPFIRE
jgi:hypothetical protein